MIMIAGWSTSTMTDMTTIFFRGQPFASVLHVGVDGKVIILTTRTLWSWADLEPSDIFQYFMYFCHDGLCWRSLQWPRSKLFSLKSYKRKPGKISGAGRCLDHRTFHHLLVGFHDSCRKTASTCAVLVFVTGSMEIQW